MHSAASFGIDPVIPMPADPFEPYDTAEGPVVLDHARGVARMSCSTFRLLLAAQRMHRNYGLNFPDVGPRRWFFGFNYGGRIAMRGVLNYRVIIRVEVATPVRAEFCCKCGESLGDIDVAICRELIAIGSGDGLYCFGCCRSRAAVIERQLSQRRSSPECATCGASLVGPGAFRRHAVSTCHGPVTKAQG
jgi:hypothetical protein